MTRIELNQLLSLIGIRFPKDAIDIADSLELLQLAFDGVRENAIRQMTLAANDKDYIKSEEMLGISREVSNLQDELVTYAGMLGDINSDDEDDDEIEQDIIREQREIPNYSAYTVDSTVPHTLYESFTHKKAIAFSINGVRHEAKDWKDVLLQTCDILSEIDAEKFYNFVDDPSMRGRKITYFGLQHVDRKNAKIKNIDVYVWTNLSANDIRNLICVR